MNAKSPRTSLDRCSKIPLHQLPEPHLKPERAVEMLLHAYNYVRGLDPDGETGAVDLLLSKYEELKRK